MSSSPRGANATLTGQLGPRKITRPALPRFFLDPRIYELLPPNGRALLVSALNLLVAAADANGRIQGGQATRALELGVSQRQLKRVEARLAGGNVIRRVFGTARNQTQIELVAPDQWRLSQDWGAETLSTKHPQVPVDNSGVGTSTSPPVGTSMSPLPAEQIPIHRARVITNDQKEELYVSAVCGGQKRPPRTPASLPRMLSRLRFGAGVSATVVPRMLRCLVALVERQGLDRAAEEIERVVCAARGARNPGAYAFSCLAPFDPTPPPVSPRRGGRGPVKLGDALGQALLFGGAP